MNKLNNLRKEYGEDSICKDDLHSNPIYQFELWFDDATTAEIPEANAMALATVNAQNIPSVRMVLLKHYDDRGLVFFTNYLSRKAQDIEYSGCCSVVFWWGKLNRQVRIEGKVGKISQQETQDYFYSRARGSQISAWASPQSSVIKNRQFLEQTSQEIDNKYPDKIPCPDFWGGYRIEPSSFEFWQGRTNRLHDRIYFYKKENAWTKKRLAP
ncbi:pyridoxamine 5'-phosphate oxidase [Candidatus Uabimicrobium sp. HlEnr_7]|uniref:pyridoxamine 5'-phosphate oxidase n=1 Tax=Candidatus Uabimicrobium helgolandensis TaxID=3095367 RepID=UPI003557A5D6